MVERFWNIFDNIMYTSMIYSDLFHTEVREKGQLRHLRYMMFRMGRGLVDIKPT